VPAATIAGCAFPTERAFSADAPVLAPGDGRTPSGIDPKRELRQNTGRSAKPRRTTERRPCGRALDQVAALVAIARAERASHGPPRHLTTLTRCGRVNLSGTFHEAFDQNT
jgi:hypothetical protein